MVSVFLGLGSNLGDGATNLKAAISLMQSKATLISQSQIFTSKPMYVNDQPDFQNQVIEINTDLSPLELLQFIKDIEIKLGRIPSFRFGPRLIDIDILYYGDLVADFEGSRLQIPHPRIDERLFVLAPLAEIASNFICPVTHLSIQQKLEVFFARQKELLST